MNQLPRIRRFPVDRRRLEEAAAEMQRQMLELVAAHGLPT
jgi:hypothetical protein